MIMAKAWTSCPLKKLCTYLSKSGDQMLYTKTLGSARSSGCGAVTQKPVALKQLTFSNRLSVTAPKMGHLTLFPHGRFF